MQQLAALQPEALQSEAVAGYLEVLRAHKAAVIEESLAGLQAANATNVLGSGVLSSLQLGPDFTARLPSLNLRNGGDAAGSPSAAAASCLLYTSPSPRD